MCVRSKDGAVVDERLALRESSRADKEEGGLLSLAEA